MISRFTHILKVLLPTTAWMLVHASAQSVNQLPPLTVLADRQIGEESTGLLSEWNREDLRQAAPRTLDELLAKEPSFSLYRRQSSIAANPTSAGVSLRNTGATAASRTLVLANGIPQNDPFGGWVYWARYDPATLDSVRIVSAAKSAVWGNQSPAGVIQMNGYPAFENRHIVRAGGGSQGTIGGSTVNQMTNEDKTLAVLCSAFGLHTDGYFAVDSSQRGFIDRKLETDVAGADLKFAWLAAPGLTVEPMFAWYTEERNNGTPLAGNSTDAIDFGLRVSSVDGDFSWQALAWQQRREFESTFSSVNADRTTETLALNQYDVPAMGTGGAFTTLWDPGGPWTLGSGVDMKWVSGETNEDVGTFRRRQAGGEQALVGIFSSGSYQLDQKTRIDGSARFDWWQLNDSRRNETSLKNGASLRNDTIDDRDGVEPSGSIEMTHEIQEDWVGSLSAGTAFRLPTLNELHRPFRVRNDIVESNPNLDAERFYSIAGGIQWDPTEMLQVNLSLYQHWISNAIANVPLTDPAQVKEIIGIVPTGGSGSQRQNVEQAQVRGMEAKVEWLPHDAVTLGFSGLWSHTEFTESPNQPLLDGKPFPQAPDIRLIAGSVWQVTEKFSVFAGSEFGASQYDDALATRSLENFTTVRIGMTWEVEGAFYQVRIENLFNEDVQTGLSSDGIRTAGSPRSLWVGVEWLF